MAAMGGHSAGKHGAHARSDAEPQAQEQQPKPAAASKHGSHSARHSAAGVAKTKAAQPAPAAKEAPAAAPAVTAPAVDSEAPVPVDTIIIGDTPAQGVAKAKRSNTAKRRMGAGSVIGIIIILAALVAGGWYVYTHYLQQPTIEAGVPVEVTIEEGEYASAIADELKELGVIRSTRSFKTALTETGADKNIIPGVYSGFVTGMTDEEAIAVLAAGPSYVGETVLVPEGLTIEQTAAAIESGCGIPASDIMAIATNASAYADDYPFLANTYNNTMEGYLFPKTYTVKPDATADDVVRMMLDQFSLETRDLDLNWLEDQGYSFSDAVIIASIIEREATNISQRPDVASVIYNRLAKPMRLQMDSTVVYALGASYAGGGAVSLDDLEVDSPYNTYKVDGLPAGPICSPGLTALEAAVAPSETDYLYFVNADASGTMAFSNNYDDFLANKQQYQAQSA